MYPKKDFTHMTTEKTEGALWDEKIDKRNKSYLTSVLHFFYYRKNKLEKSWEKEEVLTWEFIRALDILPEQYFLNKFLSLTKNKIDFASDCISYLQHRDDPIEIKEYLRLGLSGRKRTAASDIEISTEKACLWIEAKTTPIN